MISNFCVHVKNLGTRFAVCIIDKYMLLFSGTNILAAAALHVILTAK